MLAVLTNKHLIVAMIVAPILAIIAYFAVDYSVSEKPHSAIEGESYPLVAKSNCRYESGRCTLQNGDIELSITSETIAPNTLAISVDSEHILQGIMIGFSNSDAVQAMLPSNPQGSQWQMDVSKDDIKDASLRLVLSIADVTYYAETETTFINYKTGFSQENISTSY